MTGVLLSAVLVGWVAASAAAALAFGRAIRIADQAELGEAL